MGLLKPVIINIFLRGFQPLEWLSKRGTWTALKIFAASCLIDACRWQGYYVAGVVEAHTARVVCPLREVHAADFLHEASTGSGNAGQRVSFPNFILAGVAVAVAAYH